LNRGTNYAFEREDDAKTLVVTGPWSDNVSELLRAGKADGLTLDHAKGFQASDLSFLSGEWGICRLNLLDRSISDLTPIARLGAALSDLSVEAAPDAELDLSAHPHLHALAGEWGLIQEALTATSELRTLATWSFDEADLHAVRDMVHLERLTLKDAPLLASLSGVGDLPSLTRLEVVGAPRLTDITDVSEAASTLTYLALQGCMRLESIDDLEDLVNLRFLGLGDCGDIATLAPLAGMRHLEKLYAWGSTRILDNDLSCSTRLPELKEVRMQDRRSYTPRVREFPPRSVGS
jgi:internalin A